MCKLRFEFERWLNLGTIHYLVEALCPTNTSLSFLGMLVLSRQNPCFYSIHHGKNRSSVRSIKPAKPKIFVLGQ
jgi:hypothetical protein